MKSTVKKMMLYSTIVALTMLVSCKSEKQAEEKIPGIIVENMDTSTSPSNDFFRYVNGTWIDKTEIPADRTSWGAFNELRKKTDSDMLTILSEAIAEDNFPKLKDAEGNLTLESDQKKAVNFYESIMDTVARDKQGIDPLKPYLSKIDAIKNIDDLQQLIIEMEPYGGIGFFGAGVGSHPKNSNINAGYLGGGALGLSRDYYVDKDEDTNAKREKYRVHIARMLKYLGDSEEDAK